MSLPLSSTVEPKANELDAAQSTTLTPWGSDSEWNSDADTDSDEEPQEGCIKVARSKAVIGNGDDIYKLWSGRVVEHTNSRGELLALKVGPSTRPFRAEGSMMHFAATHGVLAPTVHGVYDIVAHRRIARVIVSERVPGVPLFDVWRDMSEAEQTSIKEQLRTQLQHMRTVTQPYIGSVGKKPTRNLLDTTFDSFRGPWDSEESFHNWCLRRLPHSYCKQHRRLREMKWGRILEKMRRASSGKFVLTHGDLSPRNIMVQDSTITGIIDWECSGFYPEYMEYAVAICLRPCMEKWWIPVLKEILEPCSKDILKFFSLVEQSPGMGYIDQG